MSFTTVKVQNPTGACEKVIIDLGLGGVFFPGTPVFAISIKRFFFLKYFIRFCNNSGSIIEYGGNALCIKNCGIPSVFDALDVYVSSAELCVILMFKGRSDAGLGADGDQPGSDPVYMC